MGAPGVKLSYYRRMQQCRMDIIAGLYKRGYSYRAIREEVMKRLDLKTYSLKTVHADINKLLDEWRKMRIEDFDHAVQLELERIDDIVKEAWDAWNKSKTNYERLKMKQSGVLNGEQSPEEGGGMSKIKGEQQREEMICFGDPRYLDVINKNLTERRKLLGLYQPEKKDVSSHVSFSSFLVTTGVVDDDAEDLNDGED